MSFYSVPSYSTVFETEPQWKGHNAETALERSRPIPLLCNLISHMSVSNLNLLKFFTRTTLDREMKLSRTLHVFNLCLCSLMLVSEAEESFSPTAVCPLPSPSSRLHFSFVDLKKTSSAIYLLENIQSLVYRTRKTSNCLGVSAKKKARLRLEFSH